MNTIDEIRTIMVSLNIDGQVALLVVLGEDGSINRMGDGVIGSGDRDMYIGVTDARSFHQLRARIDPDWLEQGGSYVQQERLGLECELTLVFVGGESDELAIRFVYGSESQGPPGDIGDFVRQSVALTAGWLAQQRQMVAGGLPVKPWWKFW